MTADLLDATLGIAPFVSLIAPDGRRDEAGAFADLVEDIGPDELLTLYRDMVIIRRIDTEATALQRQGELGLWPPLLGQEAAQIGSARALALDDFVFASYRENGVAWVRGVTPTDLLVTWRGVAQSGWDPFLHRMATPQVIIGAQALHATGYALGMQLSQSDAVAVAYFGDGATSEGDVSEAMVFAASYSAPVVFFCQNNQWAISEPVRLQSRTAIVDRAAGFGIPGIQVDGNDVLAVMAVTRSALERARRGDGPTFIEAVTYRMGPHTTADDPTRYRPTSELEEWVAKDPLARVAAYLRESGVLDQAAEAEITTAADAVAAELRAGCIAMPDLPSTALFDHVYVDAHPRIDEQRSAHEAYLRMLS
jgi:2-oxoisovalerate dehydrogenase E1 component alpha subunit